MDLADVRTTHWPIPFFTVWTGRALTMIVGELVQFALIWWLTASYGSATMVGVATLVALLPRALLSPFLGAVVDRWNRRVVMVASNGIVILASAWLGYLFWTGRIQIWLVYLAILVRALGKSLYGSATLASISLMVPQRILSRVAGMNQMVRGVVIVLAPALGALLVGLLPLHAIIAIDLVGVFLAIGLLLFIPIPEPTRAGDMCSLGTGLRSVWDDVCAGARYVRDWAGAVEMLGLSATINFLSYPVFMLASILVTETFGGTEREFGWMGATIGAGMFCGGVALSLWRFSQQRPMKASLIGVVGMGVAILAIGLVPQTAFPLAVGGMFVAGFMVPVCMAPVQALVQAEVEPAMQGRVLSLLDGVSTLVAPLSLAIAGPVFDHLGPQVWYICGGALAVVVGVVGFATPRILNLGAPQADRLGEPRRSPLGSR